MNETIAYIRNSLSDCYSQEGINALVSLILEEVASIPPSHLPFCKDSDISVTARASIRGIVHRLREHEPIQYILGEADFAGLTFAVNSSVLIPRPETEELCTQILHDNPQSALRVLDIGTGSGCIAVTLAVNLPDAKVTAIDVSSAALELAHRNSVRNGAEVDFRRVNILDHHQSLTAIPDTFDLIVSNPPYISESERSSMEANVLDFEPHLALFVPDDDPLVFYRAIVHFALHRLCQGGRLYFEIDAFRGAAVTELLRSAGFDDISLTRDMSGHDRIVSARL